MSDEFEPGYLKNVFLSSIRAGLISIGVVNPNTGPGTYYDLMGQALDDAGAAVYYPALQATNNLMPDTAVGEALDRIAVSRGTARRAAAFSSGNIVFAGTYATAIATGAQLISSNGITFQVVQGGTYAPSSLIPIRSTTGGEGSNLSASVKLKWASPPPYAASEVSIASGGTAGGVNAEDDEMLRARVLELIANPAAAGNWSDVNRLAESIDPAVQKSFTYSAALGSSTTRVAVTAAPGPSNKTRQLDPFLLSNKIAPSISGYLPGGTKTTTTGVVDVPTNIAIGLSLPLGAGAPTDTGETTFSQNGWLDANVFPYVDGTTLQAARITQVFQSGNLIVQSQREPLIGNSRLSWIDRANGWQVKTATVIACIPYATNLYTITLDKPFIGAASGDFVSPACSNGQLYVNLILDFYAKLGPGEVTNSISYAEIATRKPRPQFSYPMNIDSALLGKLETANLEIARSQYLHRSINGFTPGNATLTPALPINPTDAPSIFVPRNIGFYQLGDM